MCTRLRLSQKSCRKKNTIVKLKIVEGKSDHGIILQQYEPMIPETTPSIGTKDWSWNEVEATHTHTHITKNNSIAACCSPDFSRTSFAN